MRPATACIPTAFSRPDASCDTLVAFTAHEIRDDAARERFFTALHRALRTGGRVVLVEHVRDVWIVGPFSPSCPLGDGIGNPSVLSGVARSNGGAAARSVCSDA